MRRYGQMYPVPPGALKQPTDSGNSALGKYRIALGAKIVADVGKRTGGVLRG